MCREGAPSACHQLDGEGLIKHTRMLLLIIAAAGDFEAVLTKVQCGWEVLLLFTDRGAQGSQCGSARHESSVPWISPDPSLWHRGHGLGPGTGPFCRTSGGRMFLWGKFVVSTFLKLCTDSDLRLF